MSQGSKDKIKWSSDRKAKASRNFESDEHGKARKKAEAKSLRQASARGSRKTLKIAGVLAVLAAIVVAGVFFTGDKKSDGIPGSAIMAECEKLGSAAATCQPLILEHVAKGNMPSYFKEFDTLAIGGRTGSVLEVEVAKDGLQVGTDEDWIYYPLDGPHAEAACQLMDGTLAIKPVVDAIHEKAKKTGGVMSFYQYCDVGTPLGIKCPYKGGFISFFKPGSPDGVNMMSVKFAKQVNLMRQENRKKLKIGNDQVVSGHFKNIMRQKNKGKITIYGGYNGDSVVQPHHSPHGKNYLDYSHLPRCMKKMVKVDEEEMSFDAFVKNPVWAKEFRFEDTDATSLPYKVFPSYPYPPKLKKWMEERGIKPREEKKK